MDKKDYDYYIKFESIKQLDPTEKFFYLKFLKNSYIEDLENSRQVIESSPKWSIISGYYAMHNVTKYYLGLKFNKKIGLPDVHNATIIAIKELVKNKEIKDLIDTAISQYEDLIPIYYTLIEAKKERKNLQYYSSNTKNIKDLTSKKAYYFLTNITEKYINLIGVLIKNEVIEK